MIEMDYQGRLDKVQARLRRKKLDALLVTKPENRRYLSGYRGGDHGIEESSGVLVVPARGKAMLLTDSRFLLQARQEAPGLTVEVYRRGLLSILPELLADLGVGQVAFESHYTLHATAARLSSALTGKKIVAVPLKNLVEPLRMIKDQEEIRALRRSVRLNEEVFACVVSDLRRPQSEIDTALAIESEMRRRGAEGPSFSTIVASGRNSALPHAIPGAQPLEATGSLTIDMGLVLDGYCADMTRNLVPGGTPDTDYLERHRLVRRAQLAGMAAIRAGVRCCDVDRAARQVISRAGYGQFFTHSLGHGVGLAVHEEPRLSSRSRQKLQAGMVVTVEPGIYLPEWGGIRLENMVVVTQEGCDNLNQDTTWLDI